MTPSNECLSHCPSSESRSCPGSAKPGCSKCGLPVKRLEAPWSWYCSICETERHESEAIYGCIEQEQCQSIEDWGICECCAGEMSSSEPRQVERLATSSKSQSVLENVFLGCSQCGTVVKSFNAPWDWDCSTCGAEYATSDAIYGCPQQGRCVSIDDWGICRCCATAERAQSSVFAKPPLTEAQTGPKAEVAPTKNSSAGNSEHHVADDVRNPGNREKTSMASEEHLINVSAKQKTGCTRCGSHLRCFVAPWSWYCSKCLAAKTEADPIYGCARLDHCQSIDDWGICGSCMLDECAAGNMGSQASLKKTEAEGSVSQLPSERRLEVKQEKKERERKERKQQQQAEAAAMLHDYAVRCLSDPSGIHRKSCSWAVTRWLPMNYVPQKNIETYVFRALAAAIGHGALAQPALQTLCSLRPRFASCSTSAACLVEALDQQSNQKLVAHGSVSARGHMQPLQDTPSVAEVCLTSSCSQAQSESLIQKNSGGRDLSKQPGTEPRAGMDKSSTDTKKDRVAGKKRGRHEVLDEFVPKQTATIGAVASQPYSAKKASKSAAQGRACQPACPQLRAGQQADPRASSALKSSQPSALLEPHMRRRRHSFLPRKLAELARPHSVYPEGSQKQFRRGIKRHPQAGAGSHRAADSSVAQDCPSNSDSLPPPLPKSRRANNAAKNTHQVSKAVKHPVTTASSLGDKHSVAQQLAIRRRRNSWLPRKVAELTTTKKATNFTTHHASIEKNAKWENPTCSGKQLQCADPAKRSAPGLAKKQSKVVEQNVKQHSAVATRQRSKEESAKQRASGVVKIPTTQKKRKSLLVGAQQLAMRRRRNSFVPRKIAELANTKDTKIAKQPLINAQVAKQSVRHSKKDQLQASDSARRKSPKCDKQVSKVTESGKRCATVVSKKQSTTSLPRNIAEFADQSARSVLKLSKDLIVNKCMEVKHKLQSMARSPTNKRTASPASAKYGPNTMEQLPTPVRKTGRYNS